MLVFSESVMLVFSENGMLVFSETRQENAISFFLIIPINKYPHNRLVVVQYHENASSLPWYNDVWLVANVVYR